MEFVFKKLGIQVAGKIPAETGATLEGGDFLPAGKDICFIGCGLRTNMLAIGLKTFFFIILSSLLRICRLYAGARSVPHRACVCGGG